MLVNMLEAKTQLSKLVEAVLRGEEVIIANRGKPMVRLVKAEAQTSKRVWGGWEDLMTDAEIDRAFTPAADAEIASAFMRNSDSRFLRVAEPPSRHAVTSAPKRSPSRKK
jgi:prevent-host-death family protein